MCLPGEAHILHGDFVVEASGKAEQHAGALHGLHIENMHIVPEDQLQTERDAAGRSADAAGDGDKQRVFRVHEDALCRELPLKPSGRHGIPHEKIHGVFVVHKVAHRVSIGKGAPLPHGFGIIAVIFHHANAFAAQEILLPLARICGHVYRDAEAERRAHDADGKPKVAR